MTTDAPSPQTPGAAPDASAHGGPERRRARRAEAWSIGWTALALVVWLRPTFPMLADHGPSPTGTGPPAGARWSTRRRGIWAPPEK